MDDFIFDQNYSILPSLDICQRVGGERLSFDDFIDLDKVKHIPYFKSIQNPLTVLVRNYDNYLRSIRLSTTAESDQKFKQLSGVFLKRLASNPDHLNALLKLDGEDEVGYTKGIVLDKQVIYYMHEIYRNYDFPNLTLMADRVMLVDSITSTICGQNMLLYIQDENGIMDLSASFSNYVHENKLEIEQAMWLFNYNIRFTEYS